MTTDRKTLAETLTLSADSKFSAVALVSGLKERRDKNDKPYWVINLSDKTAVLEAKIWSNAQWWDYRQSEKVRIESPAESELVKKLKGQTVGLTGTVSEYKGKAQFSLNQIFVLNQNDPEYAPEAFVKSSSQDLTALTDRFSRLIETCGGEAGEFLRFVFHHGDNWNRFTVLPAAVAHHHAYMHGLIEHTCSVACLARQMALSYADHPTPPDIDVVTAGACLHDLGKLDTYLLSPGPSMTLEGNVIDHVARGYVKFCRYAEEFGLSPLLATHLGHILLSHHGQKEFGSPVLPATKEALIVAAADNLDFLLACHDNATVLLTGGDNPDEAISDWDYSAQRRFWKWNRPAEAKGVQKDELSV